MKSHAADDMPATRVLDAALEQFTRHGFSEARLDDIALAAGVTKRQLTYHFGDKRNLYRETLLHAIHLVHTPEADIRPETEVPVEALRQVLQSIYDLFIAHPLAIRMLTMETTNPVLDAGSMPSVDQATAIIELDRILLLGRNLGAFRTDVSALDVYYLTMALANTPTLAHGTFAAFYGVDLFDAEMQPRLRQLMEDTIIGFITSAFDDRGTGGSYLASNTYTTGRDEEAAKLPLEVPLSDTVYGEEDSRTEAPEDPDSPDFGGIVYDE